MRFEQRGPNIFPPSFRRDAVLEENAVKGSTKSSGTWLDPKGKEALRTFAGLSLIREMPKFLLLMGVNVG